VVSNARKSRGSECHLDKKNMNRVPFDVGAEGDVVTSLNEL